MEAYSKETVADAVINMAPILYPSINNQIMKSRGLEPLTDPLNELTCFSSLDITQTVDKYKQKPPSKKLETAPGFEPPKYRK